MSELTGTRIKKKRNKLLNDFAKKKHAAKRERPPRDFRQFFTWACLKAGMVDERGEAHFPEYLVRVFEGLTHLDLGSGLPTEGLTAAFSCPPGHLKTSAIVIGLLYNCVWQRGTYSLCWSYADAMAHETSSIFAKAAEAIGYPDEGTQGKRIIGGNAVFFLSLNGMGMGLSCTWVSVCDDTCRNTSEASSLTFRDNLFSKYQSVAITRQRNEAVNYLIVSTRYHTDDLIGRSVGRLGYECVNYPALSLESGEPLFPQLRSKAFLNKMRKSVGEYVWMTLYMGHPPDEMYGVFRKTTHVLSEIDYSDPRERVVKTAYGMDMAWSEASTADYRVVAKLQLLLSGKVIVSGCVLGKEEPEVFFRKAKDSLGFGPETRLHWFTGMQESSQVVSIRKLCGINPVARQSLGKLGNAQNLALGWNAGNVYVPDSWMIDGHEGLRQILEFTGDSANMDDVVDTISAAYDQLVPRSGGGGGSAGRLMTDFRITRTERMI